MPGLPDLPPELLEQINEIYEDITSWEDRAHLGYFRLTCRYIELSIRRSFETHHFNGEVIRSPVDKYIQQFCAVTQVPDLAKSLEDLTMHCADDGTTEQRARHQTQQHNECHPTTNHSELALSSDSDRLIPAALNRHKAALLAAFIAAENIIALEFTDYHWFSLNGYENRWETADDFPPRPKESRLNLQNDFVCDISSTFNFTLSLAAQARLTLEYISIHPLVGTATMTGLTNAIGLVTWKSALLRVETLELAFVDDWRDGINIAEEAGNLIGQQLHDCIENFPVLTKLWLNFNWSSTTLTAWRLFARGREFPALTNLRLTGCKIYMEDFSNFVLKHCTTLKHLALCWLELADGSVKDLRTFVRRLRESATIEDLIILPLRLGENWVCFPAASLVVISNIVEEDDYIWVEVSDSVGLHGITDVRDGLALMEGWIKLC